MRAFCLSLLLAVFACTGTAARADDAPRPRVGLVLGGGGARGLAHLGVLQALEALRIPYSCIAGTSAGALAGGIYASGMPLPQAIDAVEQANWDHLLAGTPRRADMPFARKKDDFKNLAEVAIGIDADGPRVGRSAIGTQAIDVFLRQLTRDIHVDHFSDLPIPFEAVATDLLNGQAVTFSGGDLAMALRASMAVPGIFDLIDDDGKLLVDGMLARNVPVENVKGRCADVVIVVDVGSPLLPKERIRTVLDIASQQSNILVQQNVRAQLALLDPGTDILIRPDLTGFDATQFSEAKALIQRGREAVAPLRASLERYAVSEEAYAVWQQRLALRAPKENAPYGAVVVASTHTVPPERVAQALGVGPSAPRNQPELLARTQALYNSGDFDRVSYVLRDEDGKRVAQVTPIERSVGPHTLRLGFTTQLDTYGASDIAFLGNFQMTWLNRWGAQWRHELRMGKDAYYRTELFQPLGKGPLFVAASARFDRQRFNLFDLAGNAIGTLETRERIYDVSAGVSMGALGEARVSHFRNRSRTTPVVGNLPAINSQPSLFRGLRASLTLDRLDNPRFPRDGEFLSIDYRHAHNESTDNFDLIEFNSDFVRSRGPYTLRLTARASGNIDDAKATLDVYALGGFLTLSGYQTHALVGARTALGRLMAYRKIVSLLPGLGTGMYAGGSLEAGRVWKRAALGTDTGWLAAGTVFVGVDTFLGPLFAATGYAEGGHRAAYLYLGADY